MSAATAEAHVEALASADGLTADQQEGGEQAEQQRRFSAC